MRLRLAPLSVLLCVLFAGPAFAENKKLNVLFIAVDDLNHWVGHLWRNKQTKTPNIDKLAARGVTFSRAYCTAPACNPSRASLMCGLRPATSAVYHNPEDPWPRVGKVVTLNEHFKKAGYFTAAAGKIYHGAFEPRKSWDDYFVSKGAKKEQAVSGGVGGIRFAPLDCADSDLVDYRLTDEIVRQLKQKHDKPFFLALGLHKPHMPWNVPKKYYDLFPLDKIELPPHKKDDLVDVPKAGQRMARPEGDHAAVVQAKKWKDAIQGYLAAIAYTDMNIGRVLEALDKSAYKENTIIVFWGDHGWHLGEKEHWRKFALWEEATRAPLIWVVPGVTKAGGVCARTVDFQSIYPTLCDVCGLDVPKHVEGVSIRKLLADPKAAWDHAALTTHGYKNHAVRTEKYRYIRYSDGSEELYDEEKDPYEWTNLADKKEMAKVKEELAKFLPKVNKEPVKAKE
jgi:arylsulfatase A-like enzyme